jgi:hypothetical protein
MFKILLVIIFAFIFIGGLFGFSVSRLLFGRPKQSQNSQRKTTRQAQSDKSANSKTKKIITKDEGEYVDFEEIKD